jgi:PhnB protein
MKAIVTYLNFDGNCREAMTFYSKGLELPVDIITFADHMPPNAPQEMMAVKDRVMHARLAKGGEAFLMASDGMPGMPRQEGNNFSISVHCESMEEIQRFFAALSEGGEVTMPLADASWGSHFGMLKDRFGIHWMFNYELPK